MLIPLEDIKNYLKINNSPVLLNFDIDATANTLTRASGSWITSGVVVGSKLTLGGFANPLNNIIVTVEIVTALVLTISEVATMVTESGNPLCSYRIEVTTYDQFLTDQEQIISDSVEGYCGRSFSLKNYLQTFYGEDYYGEGTKKLVLFHYPLTVLTSIFRDTTEDITSEVRVHKPTATITKNRFVSLFKNNCFLSDTDIVEVTYTAGFAEVPSPVKSVILSLIEERYNKNKSGVALNFGSDVQSISIPGTISVAFDYSLQANERKIAYGTIIGNFVNVLDSYRSERSIIGSGKLKYVEEV
jgi:hypothetical protein